jgi:phosphohistidine phosphatase
VDLILWRHAEADEAQGAVPDIERALTDRGLAKAEKMAKWLKHQHMKNVKVLCGPYEPDKLLKHWDRLR